MKILAKTSVVYNDQTDVYIINNTIDGIKDSRVYYPHELRNTIQIIDLPHHVKCKLREHLAEKGRRRLKDIKITKDEEKTSNFDKSLLSN